VSAYSLLVTATTRTLSTADARREEVLEAAIHVFAARGFHGTPTTEIAKAAGISQAYLFRLFPTKAELYVAVVERCFARTHGAFVAAAEGAEDPLAAMAAAYADLLEDRDALLGQLQGFAGAVNDPAVREAVRRGFAELYAFVARRSSASDDEVRAWFAQGMLMNVLAAMGADEVDEPWARALVGSPPEGC
jgi:AcrR family transcriptional regulator